jgi:hypothetical protein
MQIPIGKTQKRSLFVMEESSRAILNNPTLPPTALGEENRLDPRETLFLTQISAGYHQSLFYVTKNPLKMKDCFFHAVFNIVLDRVSTLFPWLEDDQTR